MKGRPDAFIEGDQSPQVIELLGLALAFIQVAEPKAVVALGIAQPSKQGLAQAVGLFLGDAFFGQLIGDL